MRISSGRGHSRSAMTLYSCGSFLFRGFRGLNLNNSGCSTLLSFCRPPGRNRLASGLVILAGSRGRHFCQREGTITGIACRGKSVSTNEMNAFQAYCNTPKEKTSPRLGEVAESTVTDLG